MKNGNIFYRLSRSILCLVCVGGLVGCSKFEPWVKPYERDRLADPIMFLDHDPVSTSYMHHVLESREGSRGAMGAVGGGCGCN
mgnify:CR=1 FL=1